MLRWTKMEQKLHIQSMATVLREVLDIVTVNALVMDHTLREVSMDLAALRWIFGRQTLDQLNGLLIHALKREISNAQIAVMLNVIKVDVASIHMLLTTMGSTVQEVNLTPLKNSPL